MSDRRETKTRAQVGEQRRARMRGRLLEAAARVIADGGSARTTVDDVISDAGVARGTFYNHFTTREDLLQALWANVGHDPFAGIQDACARLDDPAERLGAVTRHVLGEAQTNPTFGWLIVAMSGDERTLNDDLLSYPRPDLLAGLHSGRFRYDDLASVCDLIVGTVRTSLRALLSERRPPHYAEAICKLILLAIGLSLPEAHRISHMPLDSLDGPPLHHPG